MDGIQRIKTGKRKLFSDKKRKNIFYKDKEKTMEYEMIMNRKKIRM